MKNKPKINKKVLIIALLITVYSVYIASAASASADYGYLRPIKAGYLNTLEETSKWREGALKDQLETVLDDDLTDTSDCEQVWEFSAEEYEAVREWCLNNSKGKETNTAFLVEFAENLE